jgi:DNA-binding CsgD family transcriptional regulator
VPAPSDVLRRPKLSYREIEVVIAWLRTDSKAIAGRQLFIAMSTVNTHIDRARKKYAAVGRPAPTKVQLAIRLMQDGIVGVHDL